MDISIPGRPAGENSIQHKTQDTAAQQHTLQHQAGVGHTIQHTGYRCIDLSGFDGECSKIIRCLDINQGDQVNAACNSKAATAQVHNPAGL